MRRLSYLALLGALCLSVPQLRAQEKPKAEERAKVSVPIKVQIVFTEFDGDKKVKSLPYALYINRPMRPSGNLALVVAGSRLRVGSRVPIEMDGNDLKT